MPLFDNPEGVYGILWGFMGKLAGGVYNGHPAGLIWPFWRIPVHGLGGEPPWPLDTATTTRSCV